FFFQAEDGIRDFHVTGVQTCALPISSEAANSFHDATNVNTTAVTMPGHTSGRLILVSTAKVPAPSSCAASSTSRGMPAKKLCMRSEERRVGKECGARGPACPPEKRA